MIDLFAIPVHKGRVIPTEEEKKGTDELLEEIWSTVSPGTWGGETGLSSGEISLMLQKDTRLEWMLKPMWEAAKMYWDHLGYVPDSRIIAESCWVNLHRKGDMTKEHSHNGGAAGVHIASVYYYKKTKDNSDLEFVDPLDYIKRMTPIGGKMDDQLLGKTVPTDQYDFLMFPSWVRHRVSPNPVDDARIAISVNWVGGI